MKRLILLAACGLALVAPVEAQAANRVVEGTVTPIAWAQEVEVCVAESRPSEVCTTPEADGSYAFEVPFGEVQIEFVPSFRSGLLKQYYDHVGKLSEATVLVWPDESHTAKGIDADLVEGGEIEGVVSAAGGGAPLPEVEVCALSVGVPTVRSCGETDAAGVYELHSLPTGSYTVGFWGTGTSAGYEPWSDPAIGVTAGSATTGVDASLAEGAQVLGNVTAAAGGGRLADITVCLFTAAGAEPQRCTYSDEAGEYGFVGLPTGSYQVGFSLTPAELGGQGGSGEDGFESQYYDRVATRAEAATISLVAPAVVGGVDGVLVTPEPPAPPVPAAPIASATVPPAATIAVPQPKPKKKSCRKGYKRKKVKGTVKCVTKSKKHHGKVRKKSGKEGDKAGRAHGVARDLANPQPVTSGPVARSKRPGDRMPISSPLNRLRVP